MKLSIASIRARDPARFAALNRGDVAGNREGRQGGAAALRKVRVVGRMTQTERKYADRLEIMKSAGEIRSWKYERINLKLDNPATGRALTYRTDFLVWHKDGSVTFDEVKGGWILPASMVKFRLAIEVYPEFHFRIWRWADNQWTMLRESERP